MDNFKITKEYVLQTTKGGILFYKLVIPDLEIEGLKCKNVHNPFYDDSNPSLSIYYEDGIWKFKDHGDPNYSGDVFEFAAHAFYLNSKTDFPEVLEKIMEFDYDKIEVDFDPETIEVDNSEKDYELIRRDNNRFNRKEREYFEKYGITTQILSDYNVIPLEGYSATSSAGKEYSEFSDYRKLIFAYLFKDGAKIYKPLEEKKYRFNYVGNKPKDYVFGLSKVEEAEQDFIILTGGEKDVLTLAGLGYRAICLSSERAKLPSNLVKDLYFDNNLSVLSLYDFDTTGREESERLYGDHNIEKISIPKKYRRDGKDISDFVEAGMTKKEFDKCIRRTFKKLKQEETTKLEDAESDEEKPVSQISYDLLPPLFSRCVAPFNAENERKLILLSSLVVAGSLFHKVKGFYRDNFESTNLFLFITAPAASGKSKMKFVRGLGYEVHKHLLKISEGNEDVMSLYIPADSSSAAFIKVLNCNNGIGCLFEPEADRLSESMEKDWSDYSTVMRCAYHHEPISYVRKTNNERIEIEDPFLAILLSGTPLQVPRLFGNTENGLFSRFAFFSFDSDPVWDRYLHKRSHGLDLKEYFMEMGQELLEMYLKLERIENRLEFNLTEKQWELFHDYYEANHDSYINAFGATAGSSIKRLGLMTFKVAMILSTSRYLHSPIPDELTCKDDDFQLAMEISEVLINNCIDIYISMNKANVRSLFPNNILANFYEALPKQFNRAKYLKVAEDLGINPKSAETYVTKTFIKMKVLEKERYNLYFKLY